MRTVMSSAPISRISSARIGVRLLARHELRTHRHLCRRERHRLAGDLARDSFQLEQHAAGLYHRHPSLGRALALSHARLGRLLRDWFVREDADPDLAPAIDMPR